MRPHQIDLQFANLVALDVDITQLPDASGDGVGHFVFFHQRIDHGARADDGFAGIRVEKHDTVFNSNFPDFFQRQTISVQVKGFHKNDSTSRWRLSRLQGFASLGERRSPKKLQ